MGSSEPISCIYKVANSMREVKPGAYRPQMVLIGLRDRSAKPNVTKDVAETSTDQGHLKKKIKKKYQNMEEHKKKYLQYFTKRVGAETVEEMKIIIQAEEKNIRESYAESTEWVDNASFVDHILKDSVFIMELIVRLHNENSHDGHDQIVDNATFTRVVKGDLMLLENQLPYFIFEKLFHSSVMKKLGVHETFETSILKFFSLKIKKETKFKHFTDMYRYVYEESVDQTPNPINMSGAAITKLENADNLSRVGVKFKTFDQLNSSKIGRRNKNSGNQQPLESIVIRKEVDDYSLHVEFKKGCLLMSSFLVDEASDIILRNVIAYEQGLAATPFTSNYIHFINFLITTDRDVRILTAEGVLRHGMGSPSLVVEMVNSLNRGLNARDNSQYLNIVMELRAHYKSRRKRCWATLNNVYFSDLWTGTATVAAVFLLFLTLVGTVASVIQAYKSFEPSSNSISAAPSPIG